MIRIFFRYHFDYIFLYAFMYTIYPFHIAFQFSVHFASLSHRYEGKIATLLVSGLFMILWFGLGPTNIHNVLYSLNLFAQILWWHHGSEL
jgi:hypothetical protein